MQLKEIYLQQEQAIRFRNKIVEFLRELKDEFEDKMLDYEYPDFNIDLKMRIRNEIEEKMEEMICDFDNETDGIIDQQQGTNILLNYNQK